MLSKLFDVVSVALTKQRISDTLNAKTLLPWTSHLGKKSLVGRDFFIIFVPKIIIIGEFFNVNYNLIRKRFRCPMKGLTNNSEY